MATLRQDLGPVTAYAYAVSEGYTGTEEEYAELMASYATVAEAAAGSASDAADSASDAADSASDAEAYGAGTRGGSAVESGDEAYHNNAKYYAESAADDASTVASAVNSFMNITVPAAVQSVTDEGTTQKGLVQGEGTTQVGLVQAKGTEQVAAVQAKGTEVIGSIPEDYTELSDDVSDLKSALNVITEIKYPTDYADISSETVCYKPEGLTVTDDQDDAVIISFPYALGNPIVGFYLNGLKRNNHYILSFDLIGGNLRNPNDVVVSEFSVDKGFIVNLATATLSENTYTIDFTSAANDNYNALKISLYRATSTTATLGNFSLIEYGDAEKIIIKQDAISEIPEFYASEINGNTIRSINALYSEILSYPYIDHYFVDSGDVENIPIPCESVFHAIASSKLGFKYIEANVAKTLDSEYIVFHAISSNNQLVFGNTVQHIDGTTDISETAINSVTLDWIKANVRYKSIKPQMRTTLPTLEEFCDACNILQLKLVAYIYDDAVLDILDSRLGKQNYIAYGANRTQTDCIIYHWGAYVNKDLILNNCREIGAPLIYGMANTTSFNDDELADIVKELHSESFLIGTAYASEAEWQRCKKAGFDINATRWNVNNFDFGNVTDINSLINYNGFITTGTISNGIISLAQNDTITLATPANAIDIGGGILDIIFSGSIRVTMGSRVNEVLTSDGITPMRISSFYLNTIPAFSITAQTFTEVKFIGFKAKT